MDPLSLLEIVSFFCVSFFCLRYITYICNIKNNMWPFKKKVEEVKRAIPPQDIIFNVNNFNFFGNFI